MSLSLARDGAPTIERLDPRLLTGEPTYLFNIYREEFTRNTGTTGIYHIPACPEGQEWVRAAQSVPGTVEDIYPHFTDREEYRCRPTPGEDVVRGILGEGEDDIKRYGVFASKNLTPTKAELAEWKKILTRQLQMEIRKADQLSTSADPKLRDSVDDKFYRAARFLNVKRPWMSEATEMLSCQFCGSAVKPNVPKCSACNEVINQPLYDNMEKAAA